MTLEQIRSKDIPRLYWRDAFKITGELSGEECATMAEYFARFAVPDGKCISCGSVLSGFLGCFVWGLVNGEGKCSQCGYPARAHHRNIGPIEFLEIVLQYHPEELEAIPNDA